ncbi:ATP-binding protein [Parasphingorhabdus pacifica]
MAEVTVRVAGSFPDDLTSFVGRRSALPQIKRLVSTSHLATLTGVAGVGKSRLALRVARELRRTFPDGVWIVELGRVRDSALFDRTVLDAIGGSDGTTGDAGEVLADRLVNKRLLLVLDGCEHLLDECARLVGLLLAAAPDVRILATSRAPLNVGGERTWPVPPMSVDTVDAPGGRVRGLPGGEAMWLFAERAAAVLPGFELGPRNELAVARLCKQLDGLPLAIELAAVWMRSLSVDEILSKLVDRYQLLTSGDRDAVPQHQTLRAAVDWSFELCSPNERAVWTRLSVFVTGFDLEAAEAVCSGNGMSSTDVFNGVAGLVEKSVLTREGAPGEPARYRLFETIREYGRSRLGDDVDELTRRRRHRDHYLELAERADAEWLGSRQLEWLTRLREEQANLYSALEFSLGEPGEGHEALRLVAALRFYWVGAGALRDGRHWLDRALREAPETSEERAACLVAAALVSGLQGDLLRGRALLHESRDLAGRLGDATALLQTEHVEGMIDVLDGEVEAAASKLFSAVSREGMVKPNALVLISLVNLALMSVSRGETERAEALCGRCLAICEEHGELWGRSWAQAALALVAWVDGDVDAVEALAVEALRSKVRFDDRMGIVLCTEMLAWVAAAQGRIERAGVLQAGSARFRTGMDLFGIAPYRSWHTECAKRVRVSGDARRIAQQGRALSFDEFMAYALGERERTADGAPASELTPREREVAQLVAGGLSNRQIAERLVIAKRTADSHIEHIMVKLGFTSRAQVAVWVTENHAEDD